MTPRFVPLSQADFDSGLTPAQIASVRAALNADALAVLPRLVGAALVKQEKRTKETA